MTYSMMTVDFFFPFLLFLILELLESISIDMLSNRLGADISCRWLKRKEQYNIVLGSVFPRVSKRITARNAKLTASLRLK